MPRLHHMGGGGGGHHHHHHGGGGGGRWGGYPYPWYGYGYPETTVYNLTDCVRDPEDLRRCLPPNQGFGDFPGGTMGKAVALAAVGLLAYHLLKKKR